MDAAPARLICVYNADGGILNMIKDGLHKLLKPSTYSCSLCALTYGPVMMRRAWRRFVSGLSVPVIFHHRDDFAAAFGEVDVPLPAILWQSDNCAPHVLISAAELNNLPDLDALIAMLGARLASLGGGLPPDVA